MQGERKVLLNLTPPAKTEKGVKLQKRQIKRELLCLFAVNFQLNVSNRDEDIAIAVGISVKRLYEMRKTKNWQIAWEFYVGPKRASTNISFNKADGDLKKAAQVWQEMADTMPVKDYPAFQTPALRSEHVDPGHVFDVEYLHWRNRLRRFLRNVFNFPSEVMIVIGAFLLI